MRVVMVHWRVVLGNVPHQFRSSKGLTSSYPGLGLGVMENRYLAKGLMREGSTTFNWP